jgi:hypothetical protein
VTVKAAYIGHPYEHKIASLLVMFCSLLMYLEKFMYLEKIKTTYNLKWREYNLESRIHCCSTPPWILPSLSARL